MKSPALRVIAVFAVFVATVWITIRHSGAYGSALMPSSSMEPAIPQNSTVKIERLTYWFGDPQRGDIVVFKTDDIEHLPDGQLFLKRVIGLPGERLVLSNGFLFVNNELMSMTNRSGPLVFELPRRVGAQEFITNLTVPAKMYFVVGDNSTNSLDSRTHGPIPRANIWARVIQ